MIASLSLPQTVTWLNCPPMPILGLHLRALSLLSPPKSGWECLIKLGQANVKLTHTPEELQNLTLHSMKPLTESHPLEKFDKISLALLALDPPEHDNLDAVTMTFSTPGIEPFETRTLQVRRSHLKQFRAFIS